MRRYSLLLWPDEIEGGYTVEVPALPGCVTEGDSLEEALVNAQDAIRAYIDALEEHGELVPEESSPPELTAVEV